MITLTLNNCGSNSEREVLLRALFYFQDRATERELVTLQGMLDRVAATSCGSPGCSYCDPEPELQRAYTPARPARGGE